jgi:uncharacterized protein with GYD domain
MPTYVSLVNWTEHGIKNYRDTIERANAFTALVEGSGGKVRQLLWTVGDCDLVAVTEFPDDKTGVGVLLQVGVRRGYPHPHDAGLHRRRDERHHQPGPVTGPGSGPGFRPGQASGPGEASGRGASGRGRLPAGGGPAGEARLARVFWPAGQRAVDHG